MGEIEWEMERGNVLVLVDEDGVRLLMLPVDASMWLRCFSLGIV